MTKFINTFIFTISSAGAAALFVVPATSLAQYYDYDYSGGYSYDYGTSYDYGSSYNYDYGSSYSYDFSDSYAYDYGNSYSYDYGSNYSYDYGSNYSYDYGTSYDYDYGSDYSYDYSFSYDYDYGSNYSYDYGDSYNYDYGSTYSYDYGDAYDYDYGSSYTYDYGTSYDYDYGSSYSYDYGSSYDYDYGSNYSYDYGNVYGYDYGTAYDYGYYDYGTSYIYDYDYPKYFQGNSYTYTYNQPKPTHNKPAPVQDGKNESRPAICDSFTASSYKGRVGKMITLNWNTTGATSASISPNIGSVGVDGSYNVIIKRDVTYTLTASNSHGTAKCTVSIEKIDDGGNNNDDNNNDNDNIVTKSPRCELKASDTRIVRGEKVTLRWETSDATRVRIVDSRGKELLDTSDLDSDERADFYDGRLSVRPTRDTTYTLIAERGSKDRECVVEVKVAREINDKDEDDDEVIVYDYQPKQVTGIYLKQAPYTGFDSGSVVTYSFYGLLGLWALYAAYYVAIRRPKLKTQQTHTSIK